MNLHNSTIEVLEIELVGSRVTCNPPPTDTDQDVLVLVHPDKFWEAVEHFAGMGFQLGGVRHYACRRLPFK